MEFTGLHGTRYYSTNDVLRYVKNPSGTISKKAKNRIQKRQLPKLTNNIVGGLIYLLLSVDKFRSRAAGNSTLRD